jgi:E1A/CREB-binding protein
MVIREKMRELQQQQQAMDDRRRQEMNRHYNRMSAAGASA